MDYFVSIEKGVTMKVSKKVLLLTAIMGMTWFGAFAMDGVASEERNGVSGVSSASIIDDESEERPGVSAVSGTSSIDDESKEKNNADEKHYVSSFTLDDSNNKFATIKPKEVSEDNTFSTAKKTQLYGMEAIDKEVESVYPSDSLHTNYVVLERWDLGGIDPLDRVTIHDGGDYYKYVTYGLTELYDKESKDQTKSGFGMEFTFKLKKAAFKDEEKELKNVVGVLQTIARSTILHGEIFKPYEFVYTSQTEVMDTEQKSNISGFIIVPDKELESLDTPYGRIDFLAFIGVTKEELLAIRKQEITVQELYEKLGSDVTSYNRKSVI